MATTERIRVETPVERLDVTAYEIPTDGHESDGTLAWDSTTIVVVEAHAGGAAGLGYTYGAAATGKLVEEKLAKLVCGRDALDLEGVWEAMGAALRNVGRPGVGLMAISAVDLALWDLKARLLDCALVDLVHDRREQVPVYGSGGFTSYSPERIGEQLGGWVNDGIPRVKMKVSRRPAEDPARLAAARKAIGDHTELFVDSNGAFDRAEALDWSRRFAEEWNVRWYEEPVSSDDLEGLRAVREAAPAGLEIAAGEYGYIERDFRNLLEQGCVDCLQADVTRCGGITGFLRVGTLADTYGLDLSAHCAPAASIAPCCAVPRFRHLEYFHDHVRVESLLFDGVVAQAGGALQPDRSRPGNGLELKRADAERFKT